MDDHEKIMILSFFTDVQETFEFISSFLQFGMCPRAQMFLYSIEFNRNVETQGCRKDIKMIVNIFNAEGM